jgi:carbamoyl-phosphate synthase large subunit
VPRRDDLTSVLVTGSGPVFSGQVREFDQAGVQACRALRAEGVRIVLVNPDPATVMTDFADAAYPEPVTPDAVARVIAIERPDGWLATVGGPAALGAAVALDEAGVLRRCGVELIGPSIETIRAALDGERFRRIVDGLGVAAPDGPASPGAPAGWKEFDLRLLRDRADDVVVCSIERIEAAGGHGIVVAPAGTLSGREYRRMRYIAVDVARATGLTGGGCTVRFAVEPRTGRMAVVGMNLGADRSAAIASMALGFPLARVAAELALGYTLAELTGGDPDRGPVFHEPLPGHVVVQAGRCAPEEPAGADGAGPARSMSEGEGVAIGRSFEEALRKARRSQERADGGPDPARRARPAAAPPDASTLRDLKAAGYSDVQVARLCACTEREIRELRWRLGVQPVFYAVDACAARFAAYTPYVYAAYGPARRDPRPAAAADPRPGVVILGSGSSHGGPGHEFDHACAQACTALAGAGYRTVAVGCDPNLASADRCYAGPLTAEDVLEVVDAERRTGPVAGVIVQLGGQAALGLAAQLEAAGVPIAGASAAALRLAADREELAQALAGAGCAVPRHATARSAAEAARIVAGIGYPLLVRSPDAPDADDAEIIHDAEALARWTAGRDGGPVLIERFVENAVEFDVDALYDGRELFLGGVMEHIGTTRVGSGRSACALPPVTLGREGIGRVRNAVEAIAGKAGARGPLNVRFALRAEALYVLEVNPRASRTLPFLSKATGTPLAKAAARIMLGESIAGLREDGLLPIEGDGGQFPSEGQAAVREAVLPFDRPVDSAGRGTDAAAGSPSRFAGEVMGIGATFAVAYAKSQAAAFGPLPLAGRVLASIADRDKRAVIFPLKRLVKLGFEIWAPGETARVLQRNGVGARSAPEQGDGAETEVEPSAAARILNGEVDLIVNTVSAGRAGRGSPLDDRTVRAAAVRRGVPYVTTVDGLAAAVQGIEAAIRGEVDVRSLQQHTAGAAAQERSCIASGRPDEGDGRVPKARP